MPRFILEEDYSILNFDKNGRLLRISLSPSDKYRLKLNLDDISDYVKKGFVLYEDKNFYYHFGINPYSIFRAFLLNITKGHVVAGGSTITMQVARMIERKPRVLWSKIIEAFRALQLEWKYSKKEILEIYLNSVPFGGNIEGVGAASYFYFNKSPKKLSLYETTLLIGIPKSPNRYRPDLYFENTKKQQHKVIELIGEKMGITKQMEQDFFNRSYDYSRFINPYYCPHLIESKKYTKNNFVRNYSIDLNIQLYCEKVLRKAALNNVRERIYNGAVIVADNHTHQVLAYVGSPDYYDTRHGGQINGANIMRSPGSLLKPFLFAKAIEAGLVTPQKILFDIPSHYRNYAPQNFSKNYHGFVTAKNALVNSLNIPALRLESALGSDGLPSILKTVFPYKRYWIDKSGLTIVLGGVPFTLEELVSLYFVFSNAGKYYPLKFYDEEPAGSSKKVLHQESCYIVSEMLSDVYRPDLPYNWEFTTYLAKFALKTGTSFGARDAWCIAYNPDYTVGVWIGNVDASSVPSLVGARKASPVATEIMNFLTRNSDNWFVQPQKVKRRIVCSVSGDKPGPFCRHTKEDLYIPGTSSEKICSVHKQIIIRKKDNVQVCSYCMDEPDNHYTNKIVEIWPPEVISFLRKTGKNYSPIPPHNPECTHFWNKNAPQIVSPERDAIYSITEKLPLEQQKIALKCNAGQDVEKIYWFYNQELIGECLPEQVIFFYPRRGKGIVSVVDSEGRSASVSIEVH